MLTNIRKGLNTCFTSPVFCYLAGAWLFASLAMTREPDWIQFLFAAALALSVLDLWRWLRDLAEHGAQNQDDYAACNTSLVMATKRLSWTNIRNGIHLAVGTGHSHMTSINTVAVLVMGPILLAGSLSGHITFLVEVPTIALLMTYLGMYVWETNAVGEHACMDTVEYDEDGNILGYVRERADGPKQD